MTLINAGVSRLGQCSNRRRGSNKRRVSIKRRGFEAREVLRNVPKIMEMLALAVVKVNAINNTNFKGALFTAHSIIACIKLIFSYSKIRENDFSKVSPCYVLPLSDRDLVSLRTIATAGCNLLYKTNELTRVCFESLHYRLLYRTFSLCLK